MTNVQRLQKWVEEQEDLIGLDFTLNPDKETNVEEVCGAVLTLLDNKAKGLYTRLAEVNNKVTSSK